MAFFGLTFKRDKKTVSIDSKSEKTATKSEASAFFAGLIDGYSDNFRVATKEQALHAYRTIPQLNTLINLTANSIIRANKILYKVDKLGNKTEVTSGNMYDVLQTPHFLQSSNEFWKTVVINWKLYGTQYTYKKQFSYCEYRS